MNQVVSIRNQKQNNHSSVQFSRSVVSDTLRPHGLQHTGLPSPSATPGAYSNSCPSSWWCHPTISSSVIPFSSCLQSFPASGSLPMSQLIDCTPIQKKMFLKKNVCISFILLAEGSVGQRLIFSTSSLWKGSESVSCSVMSDSLQHHGL